MAETLSLSHIQTARKRIAPCIRRTPLSTSVTLSERLKSNIYVKLELFQKTGSTTLSSGTPPSAGSDPLGG